MPFSLFYKSNIFRKVKKHVRVLTLRLQFREHFVILNYAKEKYLK